jgi:acyl carrier protein
MSFTVKINGSNYVSKKTKTAFEEALQDDHQVQMTDHAGDNGTTPVQPPAEPEPRAQPAVAPQPEPANYQHVLQSLERGLAQSYDHQKQTLQVHEQYLHNQGDYSKIFSQLMQQQNALFANGNGSPERLQAALTVLEKLSRSIDQFHEHQAQTLNVHNEFLSQQADYTQAFVQLLQRQVDAILNGDGGVSVAAPTPSVSEVRRQAPVRSQPTAEAAPSAEPPPDETVPAPQPESVAPTAPATASLDVEALTTSLLDIVSDKTGYPAEMLELDMDMEADLGIDSIKRVEILSALQDEHPDLPEIETEALAELRTLGQIIEYTNERMGAAAPQPTSAEKSPPESTPDVPSLAPEPQAAPAAGPALDTEALTTALLDIVSDKTGYPAEMLELDMDMEADLGIDSIKRVEILSALQDKHPGLPEVEAEALAELRTLGQITEYMEQQGDTEKKA